jgi:hypothetical protein
MVNYPPVADRRLSNAEVLGGNSIATPGCPMFPMILANSRGCRASSGSHTGEEGT